jgi:hypothetical protein
MTDGDRTETSRRGFLGGVVSSAVGLFVGKARGAVSDGLPKIEMGDAGSDPSSNGVISRNGNRLKAYSAGQLIDFASALYPGEDFDGQGTSSFNNLQSVNTGSTTIGDGDKINQIEYGTESSWSDFSGSSDATWDTSEVQTTSVSFSTSFSTSPQVVVSARNSELIANAFGVTTGGFDIGLSNYTTNSQTTGLDVYWIAIN